MTDHLAVELAAPPPMGGAAWVAALGEPDALRNRAVLHVMAEEGGTWALDARCEGDHWRYWAPHPYAVAPATAALGYVPGADRSPELPALAACLGADPAALGEALTAPDGGASLGALLGAPVHPGMRPGAALPEGALDLISAPEAEE
ncbi:hypothetical protein [Hasllibacter halocynthiae]|uniref:hypothetical protein n=1 Tax=Hasllibacter halocynthiae TaxID=595589 RepID=UPI0011B20406|nr:hypothetical protein [Hasllibacter halocynthiae]